MTQTVMVIDDEIEILDMLKQYFSLEGYHMRDTWKRYIYICLSLI